MRATSTGRGGSISARRSLAVLGVSTALIVRLWSPVAQAQTLDVGRLFTEVRALVEKYYPGSRFTTTDQSIHFEANTRMFMVHELNRMGDAWQDAHAEAGPQPGGIHGDLELRPGAYSGAAVRPQDFDLRYFTVYLAAPYSTSLDRHFYIRLKYPGRVPAEFLNDFKRLTNGFAAYINRNGW